MMRLEVRARSDADALRRRVQRQVGQPMRLDIGRSERSDCVAASWRARQRPKLKELVVEASRALARLDADGWRSWRSLVRP